MATTERRGTYIGKALVIIFSLGLIFALYAPKNAWDDAENKKQESRDRMFNLWTAQTFYKSTFKTYTDTIEVLIEALKTDSVFMIYKDSTMTVELDSILRDPIDGMPYIVTLQDTIPLIRIESPVVPCTTKAYGLFIVETENPGFVEDGKPNWEM